MTNWKLTLAYDGTLFHGWQIQPQLATVQGTLSDAIYRAIGERVLPQGSGRTDTGVHALGQVASFSLRAPVPSGRLRLALNRCLPPSIRVLAADMVDSNFHARHSATAKTYEYRIFPLRGLDVGRDELELICPPTLAPFAWPCPWALSLERLNRASAHILGTHDFTSFAAAGSTQRKSGDIEAGYVPQVRLDDHAAALSRSPIRTVAVSEWFLRDDILVYRVTANGFLHHMVRNLVGTFVQCGSGRVDPDLVPHLLASRRRSVSGPTAPPTGLFLVAVEYPQYSEAHP